MEAGEEPASCPQNAGLCRNQRAIVLPAEMRRQGEVTLSGEVTALASQTHFPRRDRGLLGLVRCKAEAREETKVQTCMGKEEWGSLEQVSLALGSRVRASNTGGSSQVKMVTEGKVKPEAHRKQGRRRGRVPGVGRTGCGMWQDRGVLTTAPPRLPEASGRGQQLGGHG